MLQSETHLYLLAHQDDEWFCAAILSQEIAQGRNISIAVLTDGQGKHVPSHVRNQESVNALAQLGFNGQLETIGSNYRIPDGQLSKHCETALSALNSALASRVVTRIYSPDWEGGHPDHDAAYAIAWHSLKSGRLTMSKVFRCTTGVACRDRCLRR